MRKRTLRMFARNWRLKLAAFALSVLIWAVVSAEQVTTQWIPVRVDPVVRDPEFVVTGPAEPAEVAVQVTGPGRELWELAIDRPELVLPVREVGERRTFGLDPAMVRVPQGLSVAVRDVRPSVVTLNLQRLASRNVPVHARIGGRSMRHYVIGEDLTILPAEVRVTGPADRVAALQSVTTRPFEVVTSDSTFSWEVQLDTAGLTGLAFSRTRVRVGASVDLRTERVIGPVTVTAPDGLVTDPAQLQVRVFGAERVLRGIVPGALRAVVLRDSVPAALPMVGADARVRVEGLPAGATAAPLRVRVFEARDRAVVTGVPAPRTVAP